MTTNKITQEVYPSRVHLNAYWAFKRTAPQRGAAWYEGAVTYINLIIDELGPDTTVSDAISYMGATNFSDVPENKRSQTVKAVYEFAAETRMCYAVAAEHLSCNCLRDFAPNGLHGKPRIAITPVTIKPSRVSEIAEYLSEKPGLRFLDAFEFSQLVDNGEINPDDYDILTPTNWEQAWGVAGDGKTSRKIG